MVLTLVFAWSCQIFASKSFHSQEPLEVIGSQLWIFLLTVVPQWQHVPAKPLGFYLRSGFGVLEQHVFVVESTIVCR